MSGERIQDLRLTAFANKISSAIDDAVDSGMALDEIVSVVATVAADYGRCTYGNRYLKGLAHLVRARAGAPMPTIIRETKQ